MSGLPLLLMFTRTNGHRPRCDPQLLSHVHPDHAAAGSQILERYFDALAERGHFRRGIENHEWKPRSAHAARRLSRGSRGL
jgi:hypothetical protein